MIWAYLEYVFTSIYILAKSESRVYVTKAIFFQSCSHSLATCGQAPMNLDTETMVVRIPLSNHLGCQDPSGLFSGKCALLLCRVSCGELFRLEESDVTAIQRAIGDRWDVGTG